MIIVQEEDFNIEEMIDSLRDPSCGGIVSFLGTVKSPVKGKDISSLELEAYREMAIKQLERIENDARERFDINDVLVIHRIGKLAPGDRIVLICVSSVGRTAAFDASRYILEEIKEKVPIFKKERTDEGVYWHG